MDVSGRYISKEPELSLLSFWVLVYEDVMSITTGCRKLSVLICINCALIHNKNDELRSNFFIAWQHSNFFLSHFRFSFIRFLCCPSILSRYEFFTSSRIRSSRVFRIRSTLSRDKCISFWLIKLRETARNELSIPISTFPRARPSPVFTRNFIPFFPSLVVE